MNYSNNYSKLLFFLIFIFLPSCQKKINLKSSRFKNKNVITQPFKLGVDGVECKVCAKKVIHELEEIEGISKVEFICKDSNFTSCYAKFSWNKKDSNLNISNINHALERNSFSLKYITGEFLGVFSNKENQKFFTLINSEDSFKVQENLEDNKLVINDNKLINGTLFLNNNSKDFWLKLD